jgi:hypothetical protein
VNAWLAPYTLESERRHLGCGAHVYPVADIPDPIFNGPFGVVAAFNQRCASIVRAAGGATFEDIGVIPAAVPGDPGEAVLALIPRGVHGTGQALVVTNFHVFTDPEDVFGGFMHTVESEILLLNLAGSSRERFVPEPLTQGYWHRQCLGLPASEGGIDPGRFGRGPAEPTEPGFVEEQMPCAESRFEGLGFYGMTTCDGLDAVPPSDPCEKARKQLTALILNVCSDRLANGCRVDVSAQGCTSLNVGDLIDEVADLIHVEDCSPAVACADAVNTGEALVGSGGAGPEEVPSLPVAKERHRVKRMRDR